MALADAGNTIPVARRAHYRYESAQVVPRCIEVVDALFSAAGGGAIFESHPLNRYFQDVHAARAHYANRPEKPAQNLGRILMGQKTTDYFI